MAKLSNAAVIGTCESKLDKSIANWEILMDNYDLLRCERNRNRGGVACYIRKDLTYTQKIYFLMTLKMFSLKSVCQEPSL